MTSNSRPFDGFDDDADSGGGGGGVPTILPPDIDGVGDITTTGNITANGDGVNTGRVLSKTIEADGGKTCAHITGIFAYSFLTPPFPFRLWMRFMLMI